VSRAKRSFKTNGSANTGGNANGVLILVTVVGFILLFTYMSLNLKNIDFGYELQELATKEKKLREEIDKLKSQKAQLLNLKRVEQLVIEKLGYQYPEPDQFIKVYVDQETDHGN
jgi:cell division protein FtsL